MFRFLLAVTLSFLLLPLASPARVMADAAPLRTLGPTLQPVAETRVRMESERIEISLRPGPVKRPWEVEAEVQVLFRFLPEADEKMEAGFPLQPRPRTAGQDSAPIRDFAVRAGGADLPHQVRRVEWDGVSSDWAVWPLSFRKGEVQEVLVRYTVPVEPQGKGPWGEMSLDYILRTGAYWAGPIGRAEAIVRSARPILPDDLTAATTAGWQLQDGALYWDWRDLEPDFDLSVRFRNPFWLDLPGELEPLLAKPTRTPDETLRLAVWFIQIYDNHRGGYDYPVRGGRKAGEWADQHVDRFLDDLYRSAHSGTGDSELQLLYRLLTVNAWVEYGAGGPVLRSPDRLRRYLDLMKAEPVGTGEGAVRDAYYFARTIYTVTPDRELRERALDRLLGLMPASFANAAAVTAWLPKREYTPAGVEVDLEADIRKVARERIQPAATPPPPSDPAVEVRHDPTAEVRRDPAPAPGRSLAPYGLALLLLGGAALALLWQKKQRRPRD